MLGHFYEKLQKLSRHPKICWGFGVRKEPRHPPTRSKKKIQHKGLYLSLYNKGKPFQCYNGNNFEF